jgi:hypothetical protein
MALDFSSYGSRIDDKEDELDFSSAGELVDLSSSGTPVDVTDTGDETARLAARYKAPPQPGLIERAVSAVSSLLPKPVDPMGIASGKPLGTTPIRAEEPAKAVKEPVPYRDRREALDDAVNLLEEGADRGAVTEAFGKAGIKFDEIVAHGQKRNSEYFKQQSVPEVDTEVARLAARYPAPQTTDEIKPYETSVGEDIANFAKRVAGRSSQAFTGLLANTGVINEDQAAAALARDERRIQAARAPEVIQAGFEEIGRAKTYGDAVTALARNPGATATMLAESVLMTAPVLAATAARLPAVGLAAATGGFSASLEYGGAMADVLSERGIDMLDANKLAAALKNPEIIAEIREKGAARGLTIGLIDGLTAGIAGKFVEPVQKTIAAGKLASDAARRATVGAWAKELGVQVAGGSGGEFAAQQLTGDNKPADVILEGLGEGVTAPFEARSNLATARNLDPNKQIADAIAGVDFTRSGIDADVANRVRTEGVSENISPAATVASFTPADSPTAQAGLAPIVVPVPTAAPISRDEPPVLDAINPQVEREFGLDTLRMETPNVSTTGGTGAAPAVGGVAGSDQRGGGVDLSGPDLTRTGQLDVPGTGAAVRDGGQDVAARDAAGQPAASVTAPDNNNAVVPRLVEPWFGRKGDGYTTEADAAQAIGGRQRMFPALDWKVEAMPNGKYMLAGYESTPQETTLGTQAPQAIQATQEGQQAPAIAGAAGAAVGQPLAAGGAAQTQGGDVAGFGAVATKPGAGPRVAGALATPEGAATAGLSAPLRLAPPAPARAVGKAIKTLRDGTGVDAEVDTAPLTEQQQAASAIARLSGRTVTILKATTAGTLPNGFMIPGDNKNIYIANDADDAPLSIAMHEIYHTLPEPQRKALNAQLLTVFREDKRGDFAAQFKYDANNNDLLDEEIPAFMVQAVSKREDFWQDLRTKMGNKEFGEVAKVIISKLNTLITGAKKEYGDEFVNKYITDVAKARDLLSTAYADAMKEQGLTPDMDVVGDTPMASQRSRVDMNFKDVIKRTPELQVAAEMVKAGEMTAAEYDTLVNEAKPVEPYKSVPAPATVADIQTALTSDKTERIGKASTLKAGHPVGLRLDIPAYANHGTWVVSVHEQEAGYNAGKSIGYEPVAAATNVNFGVVEKAAMNIASGKPKATIAVMKGNWKPTTPKQAYTAAQAALKSKEWVQVGMDPERHSYFYDRKTMEPVVSADEVLQIGPLVLAKKPVFGDKADFMFSNRAYEGAPDSLMGFKKSGPQTAYEDSKYKKEITVRVTFDNGNSMIDGMKGLNTPHAMERARRNWDGAEIELLAEEPYTDELAARFEAQSFEPDADVMPPEQINADGIKFSLRKVEEINDAPEITMMDLVDETVFPILADLTAAGYVYMGKELRGGPYYTLLPSNSKAGLIWANDGKGVASIKNKKAARGVIGLIVAMKQDSHATNNTVANIIFRAVEDEIQKGSVAKADIPKLDDIVRGLATRTATKTRKVDGKKVKETKQVFPKFADFPGFSDRAASEKFLRAMPFEARGLFFEEMTKPTVEDLGLGVVRKVINDTVEPDLRGLNMGDVVMAIRFDPNADTIELGKKTDTPEHDSYRYGVKGEVIGKFKRPISFENVFVDLMAERRAAGKDRPAGNYRSLTLRKPEQRITKEIAGLVGGEAYQTFKSPAEAKAAVTSASGNWNVIDRPTGAGVKEFLRTARIYGEGKVPTFLEAKAMIKGDKLRIFRLGETENWFSIESRGNKRVMTNIMVAQPGVRRDTLFADMVYQAKANGATHLEVSGSLAPISEQEPTRPVAPIIAELSKMKDADLVNLGIDPKEVNRLNGLIEEDGAEQFSPTSLLMYSNRAASPADRIKWRKVSDVKTEIGLDSLPRHIIPFATFMRTMADKAANGGLTSRDLIKAYTIARSSMNRTAVTTSRIKDAGLVLPENYVEDKIRPEGAFGYWLLSPVGQRYLNAAEVAIVDEEAVADAVKVMAPFGTQNALGKDLERAAGGDLHTRLPAMTAAIAKAATGKNAVKDWQDATSNLFGVREAKKGFLGSLLGFGQLPTFDARQININVKPDSKEDTLRALSSVKARDVVAKLARRMDALSLTMDPEYAPFYQHLAHHAVWDAVGGTETTHSDVVESMLMASNRAKPEFYSQLERTIANVPAKLATQPAAQWALWLDSNGPKQGVKKDEMEWSGIKDYLALRGKDKVTSAELQAYLKDGGVKVTETMRGAVDMDETYEQMSRDMFDAEHYDLSPNQSRELQQAHDRMLTQSNTAYERYTLPGGENYRELLLTLPRRAGKAPSPEAMRAVNEQRLVIEGLPQEAISAYANSFAKQFGFETVDVQNAIAAVRGDELPGTSDYRSSHWDERNVLAHIRINDRTDADGKRVLFVEEVQSDWGQEGLKKGFRDSKKFTVRPDSSGVEALDGRWEVVDQDGNIEEGFRTEADARSWADIEQRGQGVPVAPFVTKTEGWLNLALKRIAMLAVDEGYDKVAFVNGQQSADRYDLSKQISSISYETGSKPENEGLLQAWDLDRKMVMSEMVTPDRIEDYIGKEVAVRLLETDKVMGKHLLDGENIKVGGKGMIKFYDEIVPQAITKLLPKLGGEKLGKVGIDVGLNSSMSYEIKEKDDGRFALRARADANSLWAPYGTYDTKALAEQRMSELKAESEASEQPGFDVTDKMRETVGAGLPMFSKRAAPDTAEFKKWFGDSKVVGEDGEALVMYTGTSKDKDFTKFNIPKNGAWFTTSPEEASMYAKENDSQDIKYEGGKFVEVNTASRVLPVYLRIEKPATLSEKDMELMRMASNYKKVQGQIFDRLRAEGYDGVDLGGGVWVVIADAKQIKSAVGNQGTFDSASADIRKSNRVQPTDWRDEAGRIRFMPGAVAYRYAADIANSLLEKTPLIGSLKPIDEDLALAMRRMKTEIENAQTRTSGVATKLSELPEDERKLISDVIEGELKRGVKPAKRVLDIAASMQSIMSEQSAELVRLGMLSAEAAGRWDGKYLPRFYETTLMTEANQWAKAAKALLGRKKTMQGIKGSSLKGRGMYETIPVDELETWLAEGWEERDANFDPAVDTEITVWRDYTRKERENMGEIRDAMFRFVMGYMKSQRDVALGRMYENLADTVASKSEKEGYVQVPKTNIEDTTARRYGKLSGKWVPQEVLDHLSAFDSSMEGDLMKIYRKGLSMWKEGKTVLNPVAHANNVLSNLTMAHFAGVSYWDVNKYLGTVRDIVKGGPMLTEAREAGLFGGTVSQAELVSMLPDQLKVLAAKTESKVGKSVDTVWNAMSFFLRKPLGVAYEAEDLYFRFLIYRDARARGMEAEDAVTYAQQYIFTYDDLPKGARTIRDAPIGIPFFSWTYKAIPMIARTALEYPWRMAAPAAAMYAANAAMYAVAAGMGGGDDEPWWEVMKRYVTDPEFREQAKQLEKDERKNLPEWQKGFSSIGTPKAIRLGTDELTSLPLFLDVSRIFPGGDLGDFHNNLGGVPLPAWLTPNNPVLTSLTAFLQNKDSFTGKEIVSAKLDTGGEKSAKWGEYAWRQFAPAIAPFNYHFDRTMNAVANATGTTIDLGLKEYSGVDKMGQPVQPKYAAMQTFGIKVRPTDLDVSAQIEKTQRDALIRDLDKQIRQINRLENKGYYSDEKAEKLKEPIREKRQRLKEGLTIEGEERE